MIRNLTIQPYTLKLSRPFAYATLTLDALPYALVIVEDSDGTTGYGEAATAWDVTGETCDTALGIQNHLWPLLEKRPLDTQDDVAKTMAAVNRVIAANPGTKAGLEAALFDVVGKKQGKNVLELFDATPRAVAAQTGISFADFEGVLTGARDLGTPTSLKVKVGEDFARERRVLETLRERFPETPITIDANQEWKTSAEALTHLRELAPLKLAWVEQPLPARAFDDLRAVTRESPIPVMLDESVLTLTDAALAIETGVGAMINIKLAKCGGMLAALEIAAWCDAHNVGYMIGSMLHSQLGTVPNLVVGILTHPKAQDVTDPSRLADDPTRGIAVHGQTFTPPSGPGLGIEWITPPPTSKS